MDYCGHILMYNRYRICFVEFPHMEYVRDNEEQTTFLIVENRYEFIYKS